MEPQGELQLSFRRQAQVATQLALQTILVAWGQAASLVAGLVERPFAAARGPRAARRGRCHDGLVVTAPPSGFSGPGGARLPPGWPVWPPPRAACLPASRLEGWRWRRLAGRLEADLAMVCISIIRLSREHSSTVQM